MVFAQPAAGSESHIWGLNGVSRWMPSGNTGDSGSPPPPHVHSETQQQTAAACDSVNAAREDFHHRLGGLQYSSAPATAKCHREMKGFAIIDASRRIKIGSPRAVQIQNRSCWCFDTLTSKNMLL